MVFRDTGLLHLVAFLRVLQGRVLPFHLATQAQQVSLQLRGAFDPDRGVGTHAHQYILFRVALHYDIAVTLVLIQNREHLLAEYFQILSRRKSNDYLSGLALQRAIQRDNFVSNYRRLILFTDLESATYHDCRIILDEGRMFAKSFRPEHAL